MNYHEGKELGFLLVLKGRAQSFITFKLNHCQDLENMEALHLEAVFKMEHFLEVSAPLRPW